MAENNTEKQGAGVQTAKSGNILKRLCDQGFDGDLSATALALGREKGQLAEILDGNTVIDEDLEMKIHGVVQQRDIGID